MRQYMIVKGEYTGEGYCEKPFYSTVFETEELQNHDWLSEEEKARFTHFLEAQPVIELLDKLATDLSVIHHRACSCCESDENVNQEANKMIEMIKEFKEQIK